MIGRPSRQLWEVDFFDYYATERRVGLLRALLTYRGRERRRCSPWDALDANAYSSLSEDGSRHSPLIDLDGPHVYRASSTAGHGHLELNVPIGRVRWLVLMIGLVVGRAIEPGYFWWSLRRGQNFLRVPGTKK